MRELQALGEYHFFNWLFKWPPINVMETRLKEVEWYRKRKMWSVILAPTFAHKKRMGIFMGWLLPKPRVFCLFQISPSPSACTLPHWLSSTGFIFPPIILYMLFFLPGMVFSHLLLCYLVIFITAVTLPLFVPLSSISLSATRQKKKPL